VSKSQLLGILSPQKTKDYKIIFVKEVVKKAKKNDFFVTFFGEQKRTQLNN
jgi:hypothetical protein